MKSIIIFASGSGTNAENIIGHFMGNSHIEVTAVYTNKKDAKVLERARKFGVATKVFNRNEFYETKKILDYLKKEADFIVLAGFLWKVPEVIIEAFPNRIINIHPALLPKYGGRGMYGMHIHKAIVENKESFTGITIHYVNKNYDEGAIIFQKQFAVLNGDTPEIVAAKIHDLEQEFFPVVIEDLLMKLN